MKQPMTMEEIQKVSLEVLKKIAKVCEEQNFRYTLAYGTLIGAIRHKGFIPWDDDIDIQMPRPDYEAFLKFMVEHPIDNLKVYNHKYTKNYPLGISRIADDRYEVVEKVTHELCGMGIFVDIYPIDGLANTYEGAKKTYEETDKPRANLLRVLDVKKTGISLQMFFTSPVYAIKGIMLKIQGLSHILKSLENTASRHKFSECEYVGIPNWNWIKLIYEREWYENFVKASFEDGEFSISKFYDDILRAEYGDYMQLPPVEKRVYHHGYKAYRK